MMKELSEIKTEDLVNEIYSDKYEWKGESNGDTVDKFQSRKCTQRALLLILVGRVLNSEEMSKEDAKRLFYDHVRHLGKEYKGESANSCIRMDFIPNLFKSHFQ